MLSPIYNVKKIPIQKIVANDFSINYMCEVEYKLLEQSILKDGLTSPLICSYDKKKDIYRLVDGYYRYKIIKENPTINKRENGFAPVVIVDNDIKKNIASNLRHNRARGDFLLDKMKNILIKLTRLNVSDETLEKEYGFCQDELFRLKQLTTIKSLFKEKDFSKSWIVVQKKKDDMPI